MDLATGEILKGTTNMHWYQLGPKKILTTPWLCLNHSITQHPDSGAQITGLCRPWLINVFDLAKIRWGALNF